MNNRRNRFSEPPPAHLRRTDLPYLHYLAPNGREPWGYKYLPSNYVSPLVGRGKRGAPRRMSELRGHPHYTGLLKLAGNNPYNRFIFLLGEGGIKRLRDDGLKLEIRSGHAVHELMACLCAASFEIGSRIHNLPITPVKNLDLPCVPDWTPFLFRDRTIFLEADRATKQLRRRKNSDGSSVQEQFDQYLEVIKAGIARNPLALFLTTGGQPRVKDMSELLLETIVEHRMNNSAADHFGFTSIQLDEFGEHLPEPTDWILKQKFVSPGHGDSISFL